MIRGAFAQSQRTDRDRRKCRPIGRYTKYALLFAIACGFWISFKQIEPRAFPVVENFEISRVKDMGDNVAIFGQFDKVRDCRFVEILAYSGSQYVAVIFSAHADAPTVSRIVRDEQTYGPWILAPKVPHLTIYSRHVCWSGMVESEIFSGALVL